MHIFSPLPGAEPPTLWPSGPLALALPPPPPPPPPARLNSPKISPKTRPPPTLQAGVNLGPAPSRVLRLGGSGWQPELGSRPHSDFPQNSFVCVFRQIDSRKNAYPIPTLELPWSHLIYPAYPPPSPEEDGEGRGK